MPKIELTTYINSSIEMCFDLSTSIDLHKLSTSDTQEQAIAGTKTGLIKRSATNPPNHQPASRRHWQSRLVGRGCRPSPADCKRQLLLDMELSRARRPVALQRQK